jgi:hypothetical protein
VELKILFTYFTGILHENVDRCVVGWKKLNRMLTFIYLFFIFNLIFCFVFDATAPVG